MGSRRLRLAVAVVVVGLTGALAGCGVPGSSGPVVVGDAPKLEARQGTDDARPPSPNDARDGNDLILKYFQAAAWANGTGADDRSHAMDTAESRVRAFFTDDARTQWQPQPQGGLTVVQVSVGQPKPEGGGKVQVSVDWWPVGVLSDRGLVEPANEPQGSSPHTATFEIVQTESSLRIAGGAPPGMMLSVEGLTQLYEEHPIYFWDQSDLELVPDLRYMPRSVPLDRRPTVLVNWLLSGPSRWLQQVVQPVPDGIEVNGNVAQADQRSDSPLVVNLSTKAAGLQKSLPHLVSQLRWSLRPFAGPVQLQIEQHQQSGIDGSSSAYLTDNPAVHQGSATEPDRYCVVGGQLALSESNTALPPLPVLKNPVNVSVVSAGVKGTEMAALVRQMGPNRQQLWLPDRADPAKSRYVGTGVGGRTLTTPVWVSWPNLGVLVSVDGELFYVAASTPSPVDVTPPGFAGKITAVAIAPDSHRLGLVAGGQVYLTTVVTGSGNNSISLASPRLLATGLTDPVGVVWSRESRLVVAGHSGAASTLVEVSPDGVTVAPLQLTNLANLQVTRLAGSPRSPTSGGGLIGLDGLLMIEASGRTWKVFGREVQELPPRDRPANTACTAPFFVD